VEKPNSIIVYGYNKYLWSSRLDRSDQLSNQQLYSAVRLDGLQCLWRHTTIWPRRERFLPAYPTGDTTVYLFTDAQAVSFLHSTIPSVTCLRLSDASVICRVTYFQFPIESAFLRIDPVSRYFIG